MPLICKKTTKKVTRGFAAMHDLLFLPQNEEEAVFVQQQLFKLGLRWKNSGGKLKGYDKDVARGIAVQHQRICTLNEDSTGEDYLLCQIDQLRDDYDEPRQENAPVPVDQVAEMFRQVTRRLDGLEAKIDCIEEHFVPQSLPKPILRSVPKRKRGL